MKWLSIIALLALALVSQAAAQSGLEASAEAGDAQAQYELGHAYNVGQGVAVAPETAVRWLRLAAEQGHAVAQFYLGEMYDLGRGVPFSKGDALHWWRRAAGLGSLEAINRIGGNRVGR